MSWEGSEHSQQRRRRAWAGRTAPCGSHPLTEQLWGAEAWNSGLETTAGALGSATDARKEPGETAGTGQGSWWGGAGALGQDGGPGAGRGSPGPHPARCSRCGHRVARQGAQGHRHCGSGSSPLSGSTGQGPSQNPWPRSVLGGEGALAAERGLLPGPPRRPGLCSRPWLWRTSAVSAPEGWCQGPAPRPTHGRGPRPHPSGPRSCPPRRTAGGGPRRPRSGNGGAPGGSVPGGLGAGLTHHRAGPLTRASC